MSAIQEQDRILLNAEYEDSFGAWENLYQQIKNLCPINKLEIQSQFASTYLLNNIQFDFKNLEFYQKDKLTQIDTFRQPYISIYVMASKEFYDYSNKEKEKLSIFLNNTRSRTQECLIIMAPTEQCKNQDQYKKILNHYDLIQKDLEKNYKIEKDQFLFFNLIQDEKISIDINDRCQQHFARVFEDLVKKSLERRLDTLINKSIVYLEKKSSQQLKEQDESKDNSSNQWNFFEYYRLKEDISLMFSQLKLEEEGLNQLDEFNNM